MVEPISLAIMAGTKQAGGLLNFFEDKKAREINEALIEAQAQALEDKITLTRIQTARQVANIQGAGAVKAGSSGAQFGGSIAVTTAQSVTDAEFKKMTQIQDFKYQQRIAALQGESKDASLASSQLSGLISGAGSGVKDAGEISEALSASKGTPGG